MEKGVGVMIRLLKKWLQVQNSSNWYKKRRDNTLASHWQKAVEVGDYVEKCE
jgi:hypothetical protein